MFLETLPNVWDNLDLVKRVEITRASTAKGSLWQIEFQFEPHEVRIISETSLMACQIVWTAILRYKQDGIVFIDNEDLRKIRSSAEQQVKEAENDKRRHETKDSTADRKDHGG